MKPLPLYLLEVLFCSGLLLAFYHLMLVRRVAFVHCRRFLVMAILLSAALPLLNIPSTLPAHASLRLRWSASLRR